MDEPRPVSCKTFRKRIHAGPLEPPQPETDDELSDDESVRDDVFWESDESMDESYSSDSEGTNDSFGLGSTMVSVPSYDTIGSPTLHPMFRVFSDENFSISESFGGWRKASTGFCPIYGPI